MKYDENNIEVVDDKKIADDESKVFAINGNVHISTKIEEEDIETYVTSRKAIAFLVKDSLVTAAIGTWCIVSSVKGGNEFGSLLAATFLSSILIFLSARDVSKCLKVMEESAFEKGIGPRRYRKEIKTQMRKNKLAKRAKNSDKNKDITQRAKDSQRPKAKDMEK